MAEDTSSQLTQPVLDAPVPPSTEIQHLPLSIGKKLLTIAFSIIVTVSLNFVFSLLSNYIIQEFFFSESREWDYDSFMLPAMFLFIIPYVISYILIFLFWKSHSFLRKCFLYLNLCLIGIGILLYILWPTPLKGCSEESSYFRVAGIFIYRGRPWDWEYSERLPEAYIWNFRCRKDDDIYDGQTKKYIYMSGNGGNAGSILQGADSATFESLQGTYYAKDKDNVFVIESILPGADPATFVPILMSSNHANDFAKDKNNIYWGSTIISGADPETFQYIGEGNELNHYFKDKNNIYWGSRIILEADPSTFEIISGHISRDKNRYYEGITPILSIDPVRWKYIGESFFTDGRRVYDFRTKNIIRGIDAKNFSCDKETKKCGDKNYYYYIGQKCDGKDCEYILQKTKIMTLDEVKLHNSPQDCWTVIQNAVYDVTKYRAESGSSNLQQCDQLVIQGTIIGLYDPRNREKYKIGEILKN